MELENLKGKWEKLNAQIEKIEAINNKLIMDIIEEKVNTHYSKLIRAKIHGIIWALVFIALTPLYFYYFKKNTLLIDVRVNISALFGIFYTITALSLSWEWYTLKLLKRINTFTQSPSELLKQSLQYKQLTQIRSIIGILILLFIVIPILFYTLKDTDKFFIYLVSGLVGAFTSMYLHFRRINLLIKGIKDIRQYFDE